MSKMSSELARTITSQMEIIANVFYLLEHSPAKDHDVLFALGNNAVEKIRALIEDDLHQAM